MPLICSLPFSYDGNYGFSGRTVQELVSGTKLELTFQPRSKKHATVEEYHITLRQFVRQYFMTRGYTNMLSVTIQDDLVSWSFPYDRLCDLDITIGPVYFRVNGFRFNPLKVEMSFLGQRYHIPGVAVNDMIDSLHERLNRVSMNHENLQMDPNYSEEHGGWNFPEASNAW
jgi:hypothetical protein